MYFPLKLDRHYSDYVVRLGLFEVMRLCSRSLHLRWLHFSVASCARHNTNPQSAILVGQFVIFNDVWNCNNWHESNQFTTVRLRQLRVRKMSFYIDIAVIYVFNTQHFIMYFGMSTARYDARRKLLYYHYVAVEKNWSLPVKNAACGNELVGFSFFTLLMITSKQEKERAVRWKGREKQMNWTGIQSHEALSTRLLSSNLLSK